MLIIASAATDRVTSWKEGLYGMGPVLEMADWSLLRNCLGSHSPQVLLVDLELPGLGSPAPALRKLRQISPATKIIVLGLPASDDQEVSFFTAGARGCCPGDVSPEKLRRIVTAVRQGEPWIRRALVPRLLDELNARVPNDTSRLFADMKTAELTRREQQIAAMVRNGESSQQIARQLEMTESTVKAHLNDLMRKLGIDDRLRLTLRMITAES